MNCVNYTVNNYSCHQKRDRHTHERQKIPTIMPQSSSSQAFSKVKCKLQDEKSCGDVGWQWQTHTMNVSKKLSHPGYFGTKWVHWWVLPNVQRRIKTVLYKFIQKLQKDIFLLLWGQQHPGYQNHTTLGQENYKTTSSWT